ncbi:Holliday junction recognition protein [Pteronotus mesoamericanus]|uniref:Holliday junction recognition protein n=1 Tax=Pteronotus mesoamericanus TaxID=1884717 RepID=UPI0023EE0E7F|nr:Holliday junction recognition protein [Pteronotus parnellii mesoamericanus]
MEDEVTGDDVLLQKLRDSRRRFQRHMQQLLEKYNQPFEDAPVVQMSTLTYETPQGSRVWGGGLVKNKNKGQIQGSPAETVSRKDGLTQEDGLPAPCAQDLGLDSRSSDADATSHQEDLAARVLPPAVPWSPLKDELRRKYLNQVDTLLQEAEVIRSPACYYDYGDGNDTHVTLVPSLAAPPRPAHDMAVVPRNDSVSWQETSSHSFSSSQSFVADDICTVTISDLYAGMLHSMSRLLSVKPSCIISTKTFILRGRACRRRCGGKSRANRTFCRGVRPAWRGPQERPEPRPESVREVGVLRECQNVPDLSGQKAVLKLEKASFEVNKLQIWKELKGMPRKLSSWTSVDSSAMHRLDRENRLMTLKWLISPVKIISRPRMLQGERGDHYRELESKFGKLHQEYCLSPRKPQLCLTYPPSPSGVRVHRGGSVSPGVPRGLETHQPSRCFSRVKAKSLNEAFANLGKQALEAGRWLPKSGSSLSLSESNSPQSPGRAEPTADLFKGNHLGIFRRSSSLSKALSLPGVQPLGSARDRYEEIKEQFDQLHRKYCRKSAQRTKVPFSPEASPDKAGVQVQNQTDFLGKSNPDSSCQRPQKLPASPQCSVRSSLGSSSTEVHPSAWFAGAAGCGPAPQAKRLRLSDLRGCGRRADCQDPSRVVGRAIPKPREEVHREKKVSFGKKSTSFRTEDK